MYIYIFWLCDGGGYLSTSVLCNGERCIFALLILNKNTRQKT